MDTPTDTRPPTSKEPSPTSVTSSAAAVAPMVPNRARSRMERARSDPSEKGFVAALMPGISKLPFGRIDGVGLADGSVLVERHGRSEAALVRRYTTLAWLGLLVFVVGHGVGVWRARQGLDTPDDDEPPTIKGRAAECDDDPHASGDDAAPTAGPARPVTFRRL